MRRSHNRFAVRGWLIGRVIRVITDLRKFADAHKLLEHSCCVAVTQLLLYHVQECCVAVAHTSVLQRRRLVQHERFSSGEFT